MNELLLVGSSTVPPDLAHALPGFMGAWADKRWDKVIGFGLAILIVILRATKIIDKVLASIADEAQRVRLAVLILSVLGAVSVGLISGLPILTIVEGIVGIAGTALLAWEGPGRALRAGLRAIDAKKPKLPTE